MRTSRRLESNNILVRKGHGCHHQLQRDGLQHRRLESMLLNILDVLLLVFSSPLVSQSKERFLCSCHIKESDHMLRLSMQLPRREVVTENSNCDG
jgi:hypothetical protein